MNVDKKEFLGRLAYLLRDIDTFEREKTLKFYEDLISDSMEDGIDEYTAVANLGDIMGIAEDIIHECGTKSAFDFTKHTQQQNPPTQTRKKNGCGWSVLTITLILLGAPLWLPLILVGIIIILVLIFIVFLPIFIIGIVLIALLGGGAITGFALFGIFGGLVFRIGFGIALIGLIILALPVYQGFFIQVQRAIENGYYKLKAFFKGGL